MSESEASGDVTEAPTRSRRATIGLLLIAVFGLAGVADSAVLAWDHQASKLDPTQQSGICKGGPTTAISLGGESFVAGGSSCKISRTSPVSRIPMPGGWPALPISLLGLACYLAVLYLGFAIWRRRDTDAERLLLTVASLSVAMTIFLAGYSLIKQGSLCPFCAILYLVSVVVFVGAWLVKTETMSECMKGFGQTLVGRQAMVALTIFIAGTGVSYGIYAQPLRSSLEARQAKAKAGMEEQAQTLHTQKAWQVDATNRPTLGREDAPVHIIEFGDFRCPHCKDLYEDLHALLKIRPDDLKVTMLHFPLDGCHPNVGTCLVHRVMECAFVQGKFEEMAEWAFENGRGLKMEEALAAAAKRGLNADELKGCVNDVEILARVKQDRSNGEKLKVEGTPTFFVNGRMVVGPRPISVLKMMVDGMKKNAPLGK